MHFLSTAYAIDVEAMDFTGMHGVHMRLHRAKTHATIAIIQCPMSLKLVRVDSLDDSMYTGG
jgi:hypothetical protein